VGIIIPYGMASKLPFIPGMMPMPESRLFYGKD
jgi:hypothetical protein